MIDRRCWKWYLCAVLFLVLASGIYAQNAEPAKETAPPIDMSGCTMDKWNAGDKACELYRLRMITKQQAAQIALKAYQDTLQQLSQEAERTKTENHWSESIQYDMQNAKFVNPGTPPPPAPKKQEPKKP